MTDEAEVRPPSDGVTEPAVVIVSGLSGGGKTAAAKLFEDLGYTVVDNLPGELLPDLAELVSADRKRFARVAIVLDVRAGDATLALAAMRGALEGRGIRPRVVFLEASDDVLIRRYSETRHRHPLGEDRGIANSIAEERRRLDAVRCRLGRRAGHVGPVAPPAARASVRGPGDRRPLRPARLPAHQLRVQVRDPARIGPRVRRPLHAEPLLRRRAAAAVGPDRARPRLRPRRSPSRPASSAYLQEFLSFTVPAYIGEGKTRLTIAIGCTGGFHRSIVVAEEVAAWLREQDFGPVAVFHRELDRT